MSHWKRNLSVMACAALLSSGLAITPANATAAPTAAGAPAAPAAVATALAAGTTTGTTMGTTTRTAHRRSSVLLVAPSGAAALSARSQTDCQRVAAATAGGALAKVRAALRVAGCVATVLSLLGPAIRAIGGAVADAICWASRQWWGAPFRGIVWMITRTTSTC